MTSSLPFPAALFGAPPTQAPAPQLQAAVAGPPQLPTCADLRGLSPAAVAGEIARLHLDLVTNGVFAAADVPLHSDGSAAIKSQIAVWLLGAAAAAIGKRKIVNLARIDKKHLFSTQGVAQLICEALQASAAAAA